LSSERAKRPACQPRATAARAVAAPMPLDAPVMKSVFRAIFAIPLFNIST
jgi:hypothetical protein